LRVGRQEVLLGHRVPAGNLPHLGPDRVQAHSRAGVAVRPGAGRGWLVTPRAAPGREVGFGERKGAVDSGLPVRRPTAGVAAREVGERSELARGAREGLGGGDDRGVGEHAARGDVPSARHLLPRGPEFPHHGHPAHVAHLVQPGDPAPGFGAGGRPRREPHGLELLAGPFGLPGGVEVCREPFAQDHEEFDVERRVAKPVQGEGAGGPVDRGVLLGQPEAQFLGHDGGQAHPFPSEQPPGEFGIEEACGPQVDLGQAGQVLRRGVDHPLHALERLGERGQVRERHRVHQCGPGAVPAQLHQVGALAVPVAGRAFGVDGHGARACRERLREAGERVGGVEDGGNALGGFRERGQRPRFRGHRGRLGCSGGWLGGSGVWVERVPRGGCDVDRARHDTTVTRAAARVPPPHPSSLTGGVSGRWPAVLTGAQGLGSQSAGHRGAGQRRSTTLNGAARARSRSPGRAAGPRRCTS